ncbi:uncharacterized protein LOC121594928 [Anopheles merus]|uniref:uncharacterized protein LOC121594928 n=1 Tax=Anopheles merus TaxID=30066 RepID=UPI001BE44C7E|nr:uncharacterized protein LOC121594928 [Anopheles merus]XP_041774704.1 uncharacterized protein LOC121594928 [Anopheles merus]XP_041774705.1 uncharacterized protein LOC121594928 [Anopheles merus]
MSGTKSVPVGTVIPPPLVPLPSCHERAKQVQTRLLNDIPFPTSYIANCRLCLGTKFGNHSTTIIDEPLATIMRNVFPFPVTNQIGLPMNVCSACFQSVQAFHSYSNLVLANQQKLQEALASAQYLQYHGIANEAPQTTVSTGGKAPANVVEIVSGSEDEFQEDYEQHILDESGLQLEVETIEEGHDPLSPPLRESTPVRAPVTPVSTAAASGKSGKAAVEDIIFIDCETNDNDSDVEIMSEVLVPSATGTRLTPESNKVRAAAKLQITPDATKRTGTKAVYICSTCNETFDKHYDLMIHQKKHFMKVCPLCKRSFKYSVIREHIIKDHGVLKESNGQKKAFT